MATGPDWIDHAAIPTMADTMAVKARAIISAARLNRGSEAVTERMRWVDIDDIGASRRP
jgi:hypothetical protein